MLQTATTPAAHTAQTEAPCPHDGNHTPRKRGPRPRRGLLLVLPDARTGEGKRLREFRAALVAHCGGRPSAPMAALIDRATVLQHHLTEFDRKTLEAGGMSDHARKQYLAWDGSLRRALQAIGLHAAPAPRQSFMDRLRQSGPAGAAPVISGPPGPVQAPAQAALPIGTDQP